LKEKQQNYREEKTSQEKEKSEVSKKKSKKILTHTHTHTHTQKPCKNSHTFVWALNLASSFFIFSQMSKAQRHGLPRAYIQ